MSEQLCYDCEAEPTRNEVGRICVPVIVSSVIRKAALAHDGGPEFLEFAQRLTKGTRVYVDGRLSISHYQSREGEPRVGFDVWADDIQSLSPRPAPGESVGAGAGEADMRDAGNDQLDDLPF